MKTKINFITFLILFLILFLTIPVNLAYASDLNWPVDISEEEVPISEEEESASLYPTEESSSLSPIDDETVSLKDESIFGEDYNLINRLTNGSSDESLSSTEKIYSNYSDVVPVVTTGQMVEWILKKGNELISILQIFAQPFAIIIFIISCALCLIGTLTKGNMASKGIMGMVASAILYACCLYAPVITNIFVSWAAS